VRIKRYGATFIIFALIVAFTMILSGGFALAEPVASNIICIDILTVNDFHGALEPVDKNPGAAVLAGYLKAESAQNPSATLIVSAGDMFQGTPDSNLLYGKTVMQFMKIVGFDAMALGNHEFDWGLEVLKERSGEANFPLLAANILDKDSGRPVDFVKRYVIIEKQGVKIAVIGIVTPETAVTTNPKIVSGFVFADPATTLNSLIPEVRSKGADIIVVVAHLASYSGDSPGEVIGDAAELAGNVIGVDAIVSGHSHQKVAGKVNIVPIVQAGYSGRMAGKVSLVYLKDTREIVASTVAVSAITSRDAAPDSEVSAIVEHSQAEIAPVKNVILGTTLRGLAHDRYELSQLGQWVADRMREAANSDIALQNGGGLRTSILAGKITAGDLYAVIPFDNTLYRVEMTGAQILAALEFGIGNKNYGMVQFSGLKVIYNATLPEGQRVVSATMLDGSRLEKEKTYSVANNDFLVAGGDGFTMIKDAACAVDLFTPLRDVIAEAIKKAGIVDQKVDDRLTGMDYLSLPLAA
jgi:5'-nucleotidase/UDP-sugar diphosphatase